MSKGVLVLIGIDGDNESFFMYMFYTAVKRQKISSEMWQPLILN